VESIGRPFDGITLRIAEHRRNHTTVFPSDNFQQHKRIRGTKIGFSRIPTPASCIEIPSLRSRTSLTPRTSSTTCQESHFFLAACTYPDFLTTGNLPNHERYTDRFHMWPTQRYVTRIFCAAFTNNTSRDRNNHHTSAQKTLRTYSKINNGPKIFFESIETLIQHYFYAR